MYPGASGNNRQSLLKVTYKHEGDASEERNITNVLSDVFQKVFEGAIDSFWTMTVLHRSFVPYDELCMLEDTIHMVILIDSASGRLINRDEDFEVRMSWLATMEEKGSDGGRGNTKNNIAFCTNGSSEGISNMSFPQPPAL